MLHTSFLLKVQFASSWIPHSLLRMSSFRRMPESSGSLVDTGFRRCDMTLLVARPVTTG